MYINVFLNIPLPPADFCFLLKNPFQFTFNIQLNYKVNHIIFLI